MTNKRSYKLNIESTETIFSKFGKKLVYEKIKMDDGNILDWYYLDTPNSVLVIPFTVDKTTLLVRQNKFNLRKYGVEFPAGGVEINEKSYIEAAKRELLEETGYKSDQLISLGDYYNLPSETNRIVHIYLALNATKYKEPELDNVIEKYFDISLEEIKFETLTKNPLIIEGLEHRFALILAEKYLSENNLI